MSIKLEGLDNVIKELKGLEKDITPALQKCCALVEASAKELAPKGTGELRRSITSTVANNEGIVYTPLLYAPYIEYGTGLFAENGGRQDVPWKYKDDDGTWYTTYGMHPHPYMRPALNKNKKKIIELIKEGIING